MPWVSGLTWRADTAASCSDPGKNLGGRQGATPAGSGIHRTAPRRLLYRCAPRLASHEVCWAYRLVNRLRGKETGTRPITMLHLTRSPARPGHRSVPPRSRAPRALDRIKGGSVLTLTSLALHPHISSSPTAEQLNGRRARRDQASSAPSLCQRALAPTLLNDEFTKTRSRRPRNPIPVSATLIRISAVPGRPAPRRTLAVAGELQPCSSG